MNSISLSDLPNVQKLALCERSKRGQSRQESRQQSQGEQLIALVQDALLFHDPHGGAWASIPLGGHQETWRLTSRQVRGWLSRRYYENTGKASGSQALTTALELLEAQARFESRELPVFLRVAENEDTLYLDLAEDTWSCARIRGGAWDITSAPVSLFRTDASRPLPVPIKGGSVLELQQLINVPKESDFQLIVAWLLAALRPTGPYPILILRGEQGSAKSTTTKLLRSLVDPRKAPIRSLPKNEHDLMVTARNSWVLAFDNISHVSSDLSDALCRLSTEGGFATRQLYTDEEETIFEAQRPIILNGIGELSSRQDLLDRAIIIHLPSISDDRRVTEQELQEKWEAARPRILGALLDAVATAHHHVTSVKLDAAPRMADFARWITAAEPSLEWSKGSMLDAYVANRAKASDHALEFDEVASAVVELMRFRSSWAGTTADLLAALREMAPDAVVNSRPWPSNPRALSSRLDRSAPLLRQSAITFERTQETGSGSRKLIKISHNGEG